MSFRANGKRGQFEDTMGTLEIYASTKYVSHIDYLTPMFTDLSQPVLTKPTLVNKRIEVTLKDDSNIMIYSATKEDVDEYRLKLKEYIKDKRSIKTTKRSLHNVLWGQCSHMLCIKLR